MVSIGTILFTILGRLILTIFIIIVAIPLGLCLLIPKRFLVDNRFFMALSRLFYWFCVKFSFLPITYVGLENIPNRPCIIVANHQSSFDIPLIGNILKKRPHIWLAWVELTRSLLLRFILPRVAILVDMTSPMTGMRTLVSAINTVKEHPWDLIIFPEGGRYTDGNVKEFYGGFALLAKKVDRPVVPIKIIGVNKVYPPHTFWIYYHPVTVIIGKPMTINTDETEQMFMQRVYTWYVEHPDGE